MRLTGLQILESALAVFGAYSPEDPADEEILDQAELHANAKLEELALDDRFVSGTAIQDMETTAGQSTYSVGPRGADLVTDSTPSGVELWSVVDDPGTEEEIENTAGFRILNAKQWSERRGKRRQGRPRFLYLPGGAVSEDSRLFHFAPTPDEAYTLRLYLKLPVITSILRGVTYDLPRGAASVLMNQCAAALLTVFGADPDTRAAVENRANISFDRLKRRNTRYKYRPARVNYRWTESVSNATIGARVGVSVFGRR